MEEMEFGPNGGLMYCFECVPPSKLVALACLGLVAPAS